MKATEALDEIRKAREDISRRCDFDPRKLVDFYLERQKEKLACAKQEKPLMESLPAAS
jgi:hypothetical protein